MSELRISELQRASATLHPRRFTALTAFATVLLCGLSTNLAAQQEDTDAAAHSAGAADYSLLCAGCHDGAMLEAPQRNALALYPPRRIVESLESGVMAVQGMPLTRKQKRDVAFFLTGERFDDLQTTATTFACTPSRTSDEPLSQPPIWNGWGAGLDNARYQANEQILNRDNVGSLELKWGFAFPGATRSRSQPLVTPEAVFIGSQEGVVYALDAQNGCPLWSFKADAEVRAAPILDLDENGRPESLLFGDFSANAYALDAQTGELRWKTRVHKHRLATLTGSTAVHDGIMVVPVDRGEGTLQRGGGGPCKCSWRGLWQGMLCSRSMLGTLFTHLCAHTHAIPKRAKKCLMCADCTLGMLRKALRCEIHLARS